ncbi:MAG TPA: polysaccharide biosynthesis C-terminal domain-containing protein [Thermoplasmata archaeon]|nr:polysaccharide biosynthesis C-terminal domain-containing protein [Thermoplasmata archaeon]
MERATTPSAASPGPATVPQAAHSLTISSGAVFGASIATQLIGFIASIFLYRQIANVSAAGLVLLSTAQLFLLIGSSINGVGDLRLGTAYTYFLARGKPATENTSTYLLVRMMMVGAAGLILFAIAPISIDGSQIASGNTELLALGIFLTLPLLWSLSTVYNALFIGQGDSVKAQYPSLVEAIARLPAIIIVAFYFPTVLGITAAYAIGAAASTLYCLPVIVRLLRRIRWSEALQMFRFSWPLMGSLMLSYLVTNMVPLIVNVLLPAGSLTIFLAANGWRILALSLPAAVATPLFPYLAGLHRQEEYERIRRGTWQALRYTAILLVPGVVALVTYRSIFLNVFQGARIAGPGAIPLAILAIGALPLALSQIMQASINAIGRQRLELYITSTQVVVLFAAIFLLMPSWAPLYMSNGLVAGSIAVLASSIAALALNTYFMESLIRVHIQPRSILGIVLSAAAGFLAMSQFNHLLPHNRYFQLAGGVVLGFVAYFAILIAIGELTRQDVRQIGSSVGLPAWFYNGMARLCWRESTPGLLPVDLSRARGLRPTELPETFVGDTEMPEIFPLEGPPPSPPST